MCKYPNSRFLKNLEVNFDSLSMVETIIKVVQDYCMNLESNSVYYNLTGESRCQLSLERTNYINMLALTLEKLDSIKNANLALEECVFCYNNTPTIAADR